MAYNFIASSSQFLSTTNFPNISPPITMACWFNITTASGNNNQCFITLFGGSFANQYRLLYADLTAGDPIRVNVFISGTGYLTDTTAAPIMGRWNHACAIIVSTTDRRVYLNGENEGLGGTTSPSLFTPTFLNIGRALVSTSGAPTIPCNGRVADVGVWDTILTRNEIRSLAKGVSSDKIRPQNLAFHSPLIRDLIDTKNGIIITPNLGASVAPHTIIYK